MDSAFLDHIRRQENLRSVLHAYHVDYYVGFSPQKLGSCFQAKEPTQAGPMAPHLSAEFCDIPAASFHNSTGTTIVYALHSPAGGKQP